MKTSSTGHQQVKLSDVVERHTERYDDPAEHGLSRYVKVAHFDLDNLRLSRWGQVDDGQLPPTFKFVFRSGMVLYPSRSPNLRQYASPDFDGICGEKTFVIKSKDPEVLLPELVPFLFSTDSLYRHCNGVAVGSVNAHVRWRDLASFEYALPPLEEQRRIAEVLQKSQSFVEKLIELTRQLRASYMATIDNIAAQGIDDFHRYCREGTAPTQSTIALDAAAKITDCKHRTPEIVDDGVPMVAPGDIKWGALELGGCKQIADTEYPSFMDHVSVAEGDLVLSRNQTFGIASYVASNTDFALGQDTVLIQPSLYESSYIYLMLRSTLVQRQILRYAAGSTFGRINLGDIRKLRIPKADSRILEEAHSIWTQFEASLIAASERERLARLQNSRLLNRLTNCPGI
jgi:type I restriction enzyme S subunit